MRKILPRIYLFAVCACFAFYALYRPRLIAACLLSGINPLIKEEPRPPAL